jgi:hypothetical protein
VSGERSQFKARTEPDRRFADSARYGNVLGIHWDRTDLLLADLEPIGIDHALARYAARFKAIVWDSTRLDGLELAMAEVATLVDGVTVGGHSLRDERLVVGLIDAHRELRRVVAGGVFAPSRHQAARFNELVDVDSEPPGHFREFGTSSVDLGEAGVFSAPEATHRGQNLAQHFADSRVENIPHPVERAIAHLACGTYYRPYYGGNDATARLLMNGVLMSHGFDAISVSGRRVDEYRAALLPLYRDADATALMLLLVDTYRAEQVR